MGIDGCLNYSEHKDHKIKARYKVWHCNSLACPICAGSAMTRASDRITHRIVEWWKKHPRLSGHRIKPIHVVNSVSPRDADRLRDKHKRLRIIDAEITKKAGLKGSVSIYHPYRHADYGETDQLDDMSKVDLTKGWYESKHFHHIGFGWIKHQYEENGWIVKNLGVRGNTPQDHRIFELARYQLSHCGVNSKYNSYTWLGELSTKKYKAPPLPLAPIAKCEECGSFYYPIKCDHHTPELKEGIHSLEPDGWSYVKTRTGCLGDK